MDSETKTFFQELTIELNKLKKRITAIEAVHHGIFSLSLEELKSKRDNAYDSLDFPISDNGKAQINSQIIKIEALISVRMKE